MFKGIDGFRCRITQLFKSTDTFISLRKEDITSLKEFLKDDYTFLTLKECGKFEIIKVDGSNITEDAISSGQVKVIRDQIGIGSFTFICTTMLVYELNSLCVQDIINDRLSNYTLKTDTKSLEQRISILEQKANQ